jgi:hypothetical protein
MPCNASDTRFIFLKVFHMYYNLICIFICTPICTKKFILVKSGCYNCDAPQEVTEWNPRPRVGGGRAPWSASHVARPAGQHLAGY